MKHRKLNALPIWHYIVIVCTLIVLTLNALPTFYGQVDTLVIQHPHIGQDQPNLNSTKSYLQESKIPFQIEYDTSQKKQLTVAGSDIDVIALKTSIQEHFGIDVDSKIVQRDNSPSWLKQLGGKSIKLGLDLSGGVLFVLEVDTDLAHQEIMSSIHANVRQQLSQDIASATKSELLGNHTLLVSFTEGLSSKVKQSLARVSASYPNLQIRSVGKHQFEIGFSEAQLVLFERQIMQQTLTTMRNRIEQLGITEATTQRQGKNRIRVEIPGVKNPQQARRLIGATATLDFFQVASQDSMQRSKVFASEQGSEMRLALPPIFTGSAIEYAGAGRDEYGLPLVNIHLDREGGKKMSDFSKHNIGKPIVSVYSQYQENSEGKLIKVSKIINTATVQSQLNDRFSITNMRSMADADELAMSIKAGSLSAPVSFVEQRTIGPSLGADNIRNGMFALASGLAITLGFMLLWYRKLGLIANIALLFNITCLLGLMAMLPNAVLTLPGIAGLVLTIGMAVDTNVLIFERIKEELGTLSSSKYAVAVGYQKAFSSIFDANITTLLTGLVLLSIGYGAVKGFAITLCLGLLTSIFTGVFVSRALTFWLSIDGFQWLNRGAKR